MPTVQPAQLMWSGDQSDATATDKFRKLNYAPRQMYSIITSYDATDLDVYRLAGLPGYGQTYPNTNFVFAKKAQLTRVSPIYWTATVDYEGEIAGFDGDGNPKSPIDAPPKIKWSDVESELETDVDYDGNAILNTAGDRIQGIKKLVADQTLTVRRNMLTFNPYVQAVYRESVNSDFFAGWPPGTCKLMKLEADIVFGEDFGYWDVYAMFQFRYPYRTTPDKAWYSRVLNAGFYEKIETLVGVGRIRIFDKHGEPVTTPARLGETGKVLAEDDDSYFIETKLYNPLPYAALGLL